MDPHSGEKNSHTPPPTLWPVGFAIGIACILVGLVVSWWVVAVGGGIAIVFGFLWARDLMLPSRPPAPAARPEAPPPGFGEVERFPRSKLLEGTTLGLGAVIGGVATVPPLFLFLIPPFLKQGRAEVDLGPLANFPEGEFVIATFLERPEQGEVSSRTVFVRYNGLSEGKPSFTILFSRCVHLGCPVQPNGPLEGEKTIRTKAGEVRLIKTLPAGFGCPCHGGQYDTEGNRTAGPPVRALDRFDYSIRNGRLFLAKPYSVSKVDGAGANARIHRYDLAGPGQHVDGWEQIFYPVQPPQ